jgi:hypothetical protein
VEVDWGDTTLRTKTKRERKEEKEEKEKYHVSECYKGPQLRIIVQWPALVNTNQSLGSVKSG